MLFFNLAMALVILCCFALMAVLIDQLVSPTVKWNVVFTAIIAMLHIALESMELPVWLYVALKFIWYCLVILWCTAMLKESIVSRRTQPAKPETPVQPTPTQPMSGFALYVAEEEHDVYCCDRATPRG